MASDLNDLIERVMESRDHLVSLADDETAETSTAHSHEIVVNLDEAIAALREQAESPWISVEDSLPEERQAVIAARITPDGVQEAICCIYYKDGFPVAMWGVKNPITHWMPLPQPPQESE